jgi:hypothetical protein
LIDRWEAEGAVVLGMNGVEAQQREKSEKFHDF